MTAPDITVLRGRPDEIETTALVLALALVVGRTRPGRVTGSAPTDGNRSAWALRGARPGGRWGARRWGRSDLLGA